MSGKKVGSDGQVRKTTSEWAADTATYPEGMRLMDTTDGSVRVSKGATYALALTQTPTPTTGQTQTFNTSSANEIIACLHSTTISAQTFVLPSDANSAIGQELVIFSRAAITTVTLTTNGNTIYGAAFTTVAASGIYRIRKVAASAWVRI